jgi:hypothetical protein
VDGTNPAPVDRWFIPLLIGFQPSKVVQDFFHPQYHEIHRNIHDLRYVYAICMGMESFIIFIYIS